MATHKNRIDFLELEMRFRRWLWHERLLESLSVEQLEEYAYLGRLPEPLPESLPRGPDRGGRKRRKRHPNLPWRRRAMAKLPNRRGRIAPCLDS